jgi:hypothetical protein
MKPLKLLLIVMGAVVIAFGLQGYAFAFHAGAVAYCEGCHTMHNSENGESIIPGGTPGVSGQNLLKGSTVSSTCLGCHDGQGSYHVKSSDGTNYKPGGDFYWMTKQFTYSAHGSNFTITKSSHGHNVIATDYDLDQDETLTAAPGSTGAPTPYQAAWLSCASCHDPHGKTDRPGQVVASGSFGDPGNLGPNEIIGNYRLLGDSSYDGAMGDLYSFNYDSPIAVAPGNSDVSNETDSNHTDYGSGMSEWCANCHPAFLTASSIAAGGHVHPAGNDQKLSMQNIFQNYISYVKTGDLTGTADNSYLQFVRFERGLGRASINDLHPNGTQADDGPTGSSNVMCLTCHRAHASAFKNAGAWDFEAEFIVDSHPAPTDGGVTGNDVLNSYYGRDIEGDFGEGQRSFCNKCHVKD